MRHIVLAALSLVAASVVFAADPDAVVLKAGDIVVTYQDVERYIVENTPPDPDERAAVLANPSIFEDMTEMLYVVRQLSSEMEATPGFDRAQAEWTAQMMYQRRLAADYRKQYVDYMVKDVNWEATAKEAYLAQKSVYMTQETVSASHILVHVSPERDDAAALARATELRERALAGEDFAELAKENSDDGSAKSNGGNLGSFPKGRMVEPFENAVWAMTEEGSISEPVRTPFGYHIIKYHSRKAPEQMPFETVKDKIVEELQPAMRNKIWQDKVTAVRSASNIEVDQKLIEELQKNYETDTGASTPAAETK